MFRKKRSVVVKQKPEPAPSHLPSNVMTSMDTKHRLSWFNTLNDILRSKGIKSGMVACDDIQGLLANEFKLLTRIGSESAFGEAYKVCHPTMCDLVSCECAAQSSLLALKKIPVPKSLRSTKNRTGVKYANNPTQPKALQTELWAELMCLRLCTALVENKVTPNLPLFIHYYICNKPCNFKNVELQQVKSNCLLVLNELANYGDFKMWCLNESRPIAEWMNAYFQIFIGIYALQKYFDMTHHDLHWGNVLVHRIKPGGHFKYTIDNVVYHVPNLGWLFTLWDFGFAHIPDKLRTQTPEFYKNPENNPRLLVDYTRIINAPMWTEDYRRAPPVPQPVYSFFWHVMDMYETGAPIQIIIATFQQLYPPETAHKVIDEFSLDKPLRMDSSLYKFLRQNPLVVTRPTPEQIKTNQQFMHEYNNYFIQQRMLKPAVYTDTVTDTTT